MAEIMPAIAFSTFTNSVRQFSLFARRSRLKRFVSSAYARIASAATSGAIMRSLQASESSFLELCPVDRPAIRARAIADVSRAGVAVLTAYRIRTAAYTTEDQTGEKRFGPVQAI